MKTTMTRYDVHVFERLVSKMFRSGDLPQTVSFVPHPGGFQIIAVGKEAALALSVEADPIPASFTLPWPAIKELASKKREPVGLEITDDSVSVDYSLGGVPQHRSFPSREVEEPLMLSCPENKIMHPVTLLDALADAGKCVDPENGRYALGSICLRGEKSLIVSTDGRQALMQDGFTFPWTEDVLCPASKIFGSKELHDCGDVVQIGCEGDWILFEIGAVRFRLKKVDGKFPGLDQFTKHIDHFSWLNIERGDADFVVQRLENLPGKADRESPVYVELNGCVSVRGHDQARQTATELRLARSRYEGKPLLMPVNRRFLKNALNFGINRLGLDPDERMPLVGYGERKTFIIMPLDGEEPKVETDHVTVLSSDAVSPVSRKVDRPARKPCPAKENIVAPSVCRQIKPTDKPRSKAQILEEAEKLRQTLRESLVGVNGLIREIKAQRRQDKLLRDTVASLRKLQGV